MIIPDANLLLYAYNASFPQHQAARLWWEAALSSAESVGLSWQTITVFLRIGTHSRAFLQPFGSDEAAAIVESWMEQPMVQLVVPSAQHWSILRKIIAKSQISGPLVMDAHLAALAIEYGATLHTHDQDFNRFEGLKLFDPLR